MRHHPPIQIQISKPCSQSWQDMAPDGNGRYCLQCRKNVVDYTNMSDAALLSHIRQEGLGCGRLRQDQLERMICEPEIAKRKWWPGVVLSLSLLFGINTESNGQKKISPSFSTAPWQQYPAKRPYLLTEPVKDNFYIIKGTVKNHRNYPVPNAIVSIIGTTLGTMADSNGDFSLSTPVSYNINPFQISFNSLGYEQVTMDVMLKDQQEVIINATIKEKQVYEVLGGAMSSVMVVRWNIWQRTKYRMKQFLHSR